MDFYIFDNGSYTKVKPSSKVTIDERIDKVLDSIKFDFFSTDFTTNIPPLTMFKVVDGAKTTFMLCSTTCNKVVTTNEYYHNLEAVELTYALQTWTLGSKAFSIYETNGVKNTNLTHINQLLALLKDKYNITASHGVVNFPNFNQSREFSFGKGTTFYDAFYEVMLSQGCIPRLTYVDNNYNNFILNCDDVFGLETSVVTQISDVQMDQTSQDTDTYCDRVEVEMDDVVDRDTMSTWIGTVRSDDAVMSSDNSKLKIQGGFEYISKLYMKMLGRRYNIETIGQKRMLLFKRGSHVPSQSFKDNTYASRGKGLYFDKGPNLIQGVVYSQTEYDKLINAIETKLNISNSDLKGYYIWRMCKTDGTVVDLFYCVLNSDSDTDGYITGATLPVIYEWNDMSYAMVNKEQYELLEERVKPAYVYYDNNNGSINGFFKTTNDDLWGTIFLYKKGPFISEFSNSMQFGRDFVDNVTEEFTAITKAQFFMPISALGENFNDTEYGFEPSVTNSNDFTKYQYKVEYKAKTPFSNVSKKNGTNYKVCARSYNNGANSVDFNQLVIDMKREVNQLGLPCRSVESLTNVPIGTHTQYGYVVSKQTTYTPSNEHKLYTYNCYPNVNQIAIAIGVDTQYEATNIPQTGVVDRHIFIEIANSTFKSQISDTDNVMLMLEYNDQKACLFTSKLQYGTDVYFVAKTENNYSLGTQRLATAQTGYYVNNEVRFGDSNCYLQKVKVGLAINNTFSDTELNNYPLIELGATIKTALVERTIYKDPREKLIFTIKLV